MNERIILKEFTIETEIYSVALSEKIAKALADEGVIPDAELHYDVDIVFDKKVYSNAEFYRYPMPEKEGPKENTKSKREQVKEYLHMVLSSQLDAAKKAIEAHGLLIGSASIIGDVHGDGVSVIIYEGEKIEPVQSKKGSENFSVSCIVPDRPFIQEQMAKIIVNMFRQSIQEEGIYEIERKLHTPNYISADEVFTSIFRAFCSESTPETEPLKNKLIDEARIESDWPLHICSRSCQNQDRKIEATTLLDCSEYMVFQRYQSSRW